MHIITERLEPFWIDPGEARGLAGLALLVSFVLPSRWEVSREMTFNVWPREVHAAAGDLIREAEG